MAVSDSPENISPERLDVEAVSPAGVGSDNIEGYPDTSLPVDARAPRDTGQVLPDPDAEEDGRGIDGAADEEVEADTSEYLRATAQAAGKTATEGTGVEGGEDTDEADAAEEDREARQERTETRHRLAQRGRGGRAKNRRDSSGGEDEDMEVRVEPVGLFGPRPMRYTRQPDGGWAPGKPVGSGLTRAARR